MIDVDEVEPGGLLPKPDLAGPGLADLDRLPLQDIGPAGLMDPDRVRHAPRMRPRAGKEKPRRGSAGRGFL